MLGSGSRLPLYSRDEERFALVDFNVHLLRGLHQVHHPRILLFDCFNHVERAAALVQEVHRLRFLVDACVQLTSRDHPKDQRLYFRGLLLANLARDFREAKGHVNVSECAHILSVELLEHELCKSKVFVGLETVELGRNRLLQVMAVSKLPGILNAQVRRKVGLRVELRAGSLVQILRVLLCILKPENS